MRHAHEVCIVALPLEVLAPTRICRDKGTHTYECINPHKRLRHHVTRDCVDSERIADSDRHARH